MVISVGSIAVMIQLIKVHTILIQQLFRLIILGAQSQIVVECVDFLNLIILRRILNIPKDLRKLLSLLNVFLTEFLDILVRTFIFLV